VGDDSGNGEQRKKRDDELIEDYLVERQELSSGTRFHVPPFTIKQIEGTRTIYYAPTGEDPAAQLERMRSGPQAPEPAAPAPVQARQPQPAPARVTDPIAPRLLDQAPPVPERREPVVPAANLVEPSREHLQAALKEATGKPPADPAFSPGRSGEPAGPEAPEPAMPRLFEPSRPVSFRKPFVKPDTFGAKKVGLPPLPRKVSARELIAKLRVVKEGVLTRDQIVQGLAEKEEASHEVTAGEEEEAPGIAAELAGESSRTGEEPAPLAPAPQTAEPEEERKSEGGKLCPSCGAPISEKNRLLICTDCGRKNCDTCGRYEKSHMKSDVYYEYRFDWPLCLGCYEKAFTIQRMLGRASVCYGNGNFSYATWYANNALQQDPESRYVPKINDLIEKIKLASKAASERDREWRFARKQFSRQPAEDPRWRQ